MSAFTTITAGLDWQPLAFINELVKGFSERRQASGGAAFDLVVSGDALQDPAFWQALQNGIDGIVTSFCDHVNGVPIAGRTSVLMFTLAAWRAAAGLHVDGWRRATEWDLATNDWTDPADAMYSHGVLQDKDIIGPWLMDDLQKALSALKWTKKLAAVEHIDGSSKNGGGADADCATARAACETDYNTGSGAPGAYYFCQRTADTSYSFYAWRDRSKCRASSVPNPAGVTLDYEVYGIPSAGFYAFQDLDGLGLVENVLCLLASAAGASGTTLTTDFIGPATFPLDCAPAVNCPLGVGTSGGVIVAPRPYWILIWNFTNSN
jgi:hypothetical protein